MHLGEHPFPMSAQHLHPARLLGPPLPNLSLTAPIPEFQRRSASLGVAVYERPEAQS